MKHLLALVFIVISTNVVAFPMNDNQQQTDWQTQQQEQLLLKQMSMVKQAWSFAQNYLHGTTVRRDLVKAYAWMNLYVQSLPDSYPGLSDMLAKLRTELSDSELERANQLSQFYREKYDLDFKFSEKELVQLQQLSEHQHHFLPEDFEPNLPEFASLVDRLKQRQKPALATLLQQQMVAAKEKIQEGKASRIVYGRVFVAGARLPQEVVSQIPVAKDGYFVGALTKKTKKIDFQLTGYQSVSLPIAKQTNQPMNIGIIKMLPLPKKEQAKIVGSVSSLTKMDDVNVALQLKLAAKKPTAANDDEDDPWWWSVTPITMLPSGEFYALGLSPTQYRLVISRDGKKIVIRDIDLKPGETRQVGRYNVG